MSIIKLESLKVLGLRVAIKREAKDKQTTGGVLLPSSTGDKPTTGQVIAIGSGEKTKDGQQLTVDNIKVGDTVLFQKWGGTEIKVGEDEVVIMNASDILAIV